MATKKKVSRVAPVETPAPAPPPRKGDLSGPVQTESGRFFPKDDLNLLELAQLRITALNGEISLRESKIDSLEAHTRLTVLALQDEIKRLSADREKRLAELNKVYAAITEVYGVNVATLRYDPVSGRILPV
jgi:hypothetical protein